MGWTYDKTTGVWSFKDGKRAIIEGGEGFPYVSDILEAGVGAVKQLVQPFVNAYEHFTYPSLRSNYIQAIENPTKEGFNEKTQTWTPPTRAGFDQNQIGIGLDMRNNIAVKNFLEQNKRTNSPYLTQDEMVQLQNQHFDYLEGVLAKHTKGMNLSNTKRAIAIGLLYRGDGPCLWSPKDERSRKISNAFFKGTDKDFIDAVTAFYYGVLTERSKNHSNFWKTQQ